MPSKVIAASAYGAARAGAQRLYQLLARCQIGMLQQFRQRESRRFLGHQHGGMIDHRLNELLAFLHLALAGINLRQRQFGQRSLRPVAGIDRCLEMLLGLRQVAVVRGVGA